MLLKQQFRTLAGSLRHANFENARNKLHHHEPVRCIDGEPDNDPIDRSRFERYTWRLTKTLRRQVAPAAEPYPARAVSARG